MYMEFLRNNSDDRPILVGTSEFKDMRKAFYQGFIECYLLMFPYISEDDGSRMADKYEPEMVRGCVNKLLTNNL